MAVMALMVLQAWSDALSHPGTMLQQFELGVCNQLIAMGHIKLNATNFSAVGIDRSLLPFWWFDPSCDCDCVLAKATVKAESALGAVTAGAATLQQVLAMVAPAADGISNLATSIGTTLLTDVDKHFKSVVNGPTGVVNVVMEGPRTGPCHPMSMLCHHQPHAA